LLAHCTEDILKKLACHGVIVLTDPLHTSHIFQVLDLLLFGVLQRAKKHQRRDDELRAQVDHVLRLFRASEQARTSATARASWMRTGFQYEEMADTRHLTVNEAAIRSPPGFQEIWQFSCVLDRLSARTQSQNGAGSTSILFAKKRFSASTINVE
jgi:hypothetical protein